MTVTVQSFRRNFPEFENDEHYADSQIEFWGSIAALVLNPRRWFSLLDLAIQLYIAHQLVLSRQALNATEGGGVPGLDVGILTGKSVGDVSAQYSIDAQGMDIFWSKTIYGQRFYELYMMAGAGPIQVGINPFVAPATVGWAGANVLQPWVTG